MSEQTNHLRDRGIWTRRRLLRDAALGLGAWGLGAWTLRASVSVAAEDPFKVPQATTAALDSSSLVYISPLRKEGSESRCHGEVWYFVDGESVVIVTSQDSWKGRSIRAGGDRARLWVGDFGTVGSAGKRYRKAPNFLARSEIVADRPLFDRLMSAYAERYPDEWGKWQPRFEKGYGDGSRVMIRYTPIAN